MEAPEKIYIHPDVSDNNRVLSEWMERPLGKESVEYVRTDAFIEKACKAYCKVCKMPNCNSSECKSISTFRNYITGSK